MAETGKDEPLRASRVTLILVAFAVLFSLPALRGSGRDLDYLGNFLNFLSRFLQPDFSIWWNVVEALTETLRIAVMSTLFAVILSLPFGAIAAHNVAPWPLVWLSRFALNVVRAIPSLVWALLCVAVVGTNPLAGVLALTFYSLGYLGKFFSEAFESADVDVPAALESMGADPVQRIQYGLWPHARPLIWSHSLWMFEYNIRSAAIIGYVGAGGIGTLLQSYQDLRHWDKFAVVLIFIVAIVTLLDFAGEKIRRELTGRTGAAT